MNAVVCFYLDEFYTQYSYLSFRFGACFTNVCVLLKDAATNLAIML